jgi:preprotein translocase subunit SecG
MYALAILSEEVNQPDVTWLLWAALGFFALMLVVGWLSSRKQKPEAEAPAHEHHEGHGH